MPELHTASALSFAAFFPQKTTDDQDIHIVFTYDLGRRGSIFYKTRQFCKGRENGVKYAKG